MSSIVMHVFPNDTHPLSLSLGPMRDISVHASVMVHDTTLDNSNHRGAHYVPQNIIPSRRAIRPLKQYILLSLNSYHNHVSDTMQLTCSNQKRGDNHFDNKAQFATRNTTLTNKQQVSKSFSKSHKEIHEFHTLNKSLKIHLPLSIDNHSRT